MNALTWLRDAIRLLRDAGIRFPEKEAEEILKHAGIDPVTLYRDLPELKEPELKELNNILQRRANREPLQYILGYTYFLDLKIKTKKGVLIPRPETELLALEAIKKAQTGSRVTVLDLCTGSGCIAIAIGKAIKEAQVYGTDISEVAIRLAEENAELNNVKNVTFLKGDLFEPFKDSDIRFDIITANPPYIKSGDIPYLEPEVRDWEPHLALDGGADGTEYYRRIFKESHQYLKKGGALFLELGEGLYKELISLAKLYMLKESYVVKDFCGKERVLCLEIEERRQP